MGRDPLNPFKKDQDLDSTVTYGTEYNFTNLIDHFGTGLTQTFNQRYWVNDTYYKAGGPVVLYLCGEWTCSATNPKTNPAFQFGIKHNAMLITLEHRFYGASQPFTTAQGGWSYNNLKYLNTTQALADTNNFITSYKADMTNTTDNWLIVGGSYPGALVAWFKHLYPDSVKAAWSSSGVINTIEDFKDFDLDILQNTRKTFGGCEREIAMVTADIERVLSHGTAENITDLFDLFNNKNPNINHGDFMWFISDVFTMGVQYGHRKDMCAIIEH